MSFFNGQSFLVNINNKHCRRSTVHVANTAELLGKLVLFAFKKQKLLLSQTRSTNISEVHFLKFLETLYASGNSLEVRQHTAEPTLAHVRHVHTSSLILHSLLSLLLGTHEQNSTVVSNSLLNEVISLVDHVERLEQIDDMNTIALG
ncbi:Uncharacterised protein [Chlamydia trachomatis]|nr:Uncharacterised protein [Chlamydia trachomatis]